MQILKQICDVDFGVIDSFDGEKIGIKRVHGDILIVKGACEDDLNALMTFGVIEGENSARVAFYKSVQEIEQMISGKEKE